MRCPRCGLVHPPMDRVCRRCEIDLATGEPAAIECPAPPRETRPSPLQTLGAAGPAVEKAGAVINRLIERAAPRRKAAAVPQEEGAAAEAIKRAPAIPGAKRAAALIARLKPDKGVVALHCPHCAGNMVIKREQPYSRTGPLALMATAAVLAVAGFFFPLLFITAAMAAGAGIVYMKAGKTYWQCDLCGFTVHRTQ